MFSGNDISESDNDPLEFAAMNRGKLTERTDFSFDVST